MSDTENTVKGIENTVKDIVIDQLDAKPNEVTRETSFVDDLQADSLAIVELVLALEERFNVKIPDDEVDRIKTVGDAVDYIHKHEGT
ncbi:MAG: acyl carrier protein [Myxococcota bacterium]